MVRAARNFAANSAWSCFGRRAAAGAAAPRAPWRGRAPALLLLGDALVEARVLDGDGDLRGERGDGALVVFVEVVGAGVFDIEHADDLALVDQRHGHLGARLGVDHVIARIFADVADQHGAALGAAADESAVPAALVVGDVALAEAHAITGSRAPGRARSAARW
jgi:hypothetical protein